MEEIEKFVTRVSEGEFWNGYGGAEGVIGYGEGASGGDAFCCL